MDTIQTNVRVAEADKLLIIALAARLRAEPAFRDRLAALLADQATPLLEERLKALEQQVSWLLSGAIVMPRSAARAVAPPPRPTTAPKPGPGRSER